MDHYSFRLFFVDIAFPYFPSITNAAPLLFIHDNSVLPIHPICNIEVAMVAPAPPCELR